MPARMHFTTKIVCKLFHMYCAIGVGIVIRALRLNKIGNELNKIRLKLKDVLIF